MKKHAVNNNAYVKHDDGSERPAVIFSAGSLFGSGGNEHRACAHTSRIQACMAAAHHYVCIFRLFVRPYALPQELLQTALAAHA